MVCLKTTRLENGFFGPLDFSKPHETDKKVLEEFTKHEAIFDSFIKKAASNRICDFSKEEMPIDPGLELRKLLHSTEGTREAIEYFIKQCPNCFFGLIGCCGQGKLIAKVVKTTGLTELMCQLIDEYQKIKPINMSPSPFFHPPIMTPSPSMPTIRPMRFPIFGIPLEDINLIGIQPQKVIKDENDSNVQEGDVE